MKIILRVIAISLIFGIFVSFACSCATETTKTEPKKNSNVFNIIYTQGDYSTAYAAIEAIKNGYETYVMTAMGEVLFGIDKLERFHNIGFDSSINKGNFTEDDFNLVIQKVEELNKTTKRAFFNFYCQDGTALTCAAIAANAGIKESNFHIYMIENENGFNKFKPDFRDTTFYQERGSDFQFLVKILRGSTLTPKVDGIYDRYVTRLNELSGVFSEIIYPSFILFSL